MAAIPGTQAGQISKKFAAYSEVPLTSAPGPTALAIPANPTASGPEWATLIAAGTLLAGGALLVTGHKKTGLAVAAAGTAIAVLDQQEAVQTWWKNLPGYLQEAQAFLDKAEGYMQEVATQGHKLQGILRR